MTEFPFGRSIPRTDCWKCGGIDNLTRHHAIPKRLKPKKNAYIILCRKCHDLVHAIDNPEVLVILNRVRKTIDKLIGRSDQIGLDARNAAKELSDLKKNVKYK